MMWRLSADRPVRFRGWDGEFVLYNGLSGDTHLLGVGAMHILNALQEAEVDEVALTASVCAVLQIEADHQARHDVRQLLADLARLSLIECCENTAIEQCEHCEHTSVGHCGRSHT